MIKNELFKKQGYLYVPAVTDIWEKESNTAPEERGSYVFDKVKKEMTYRDVDTQVLGSYSRYNEPEYKDAHVDIQKKIENIIGAKLYRTYYYDRFYFPGQELTKHVDRPSCEISITVHLKSNLRRPWEFWIQTPEGENRSVVMKPGDGVIYMGCERMHWRNPMPGIKENKIRKKFGMSELFYHQIFFHYVLANGLNVHHAGDSC